MQLPITFAILSLAFAGLNDVVFKRYNLVERSRGVMICATGVVWMILVLLDMALSETKVNFVVRTLPYLIGASLLLAVANILLLESLRHLEVSLGATIYRLNTIGVVVLSVLLLGESLSFYKLLGIAFGVAAALVLYRPFGTKANSPHAHLGLIVVLIAALFRAGYAIVTKAGLILGVDQNTLVLVSALCWVLGGLIYAMIIERRFSIAKAEVLYALVSGTLVYLIIKTLVLALSLGEASVVITIANMSFVMAFVTAVLLKMERFDWRKLGALSFAIVAIVLLSNS